MRITQFDNGIAEELLFLQFPFLFDKQFCIDEKKLSKNFTIQGQFFSSKKLSVSFFIGKTIFFVGFYYKWYLL